MSLDLRLSVLGSENIALGHLCARGSKSPLAPCISALKDPGSDVEGFLSRMVEDSSSSNLHSSVLLVNVAGCGPCADEGSPARAPCCSTVAYLVDSPVAGEGMADRGEDIAERGAGPIPDYGLLDMPVGTSSPVSRLAWNRPDLAAPISSASPVRGSSSEPVVSLVDGTGFRRGCNWTRRLATIRSS